MPSSEMNYCRRRTGEPLRTNLSPWMPVPRVKGSAEKRTFTREPGPIVLRIPPIPLPLSVLEGTRTRLLLGQKEILLGAGRWTRKKKKKPAFRRETQEGSWR